jgi:YHS domain-containing protein
MFKKSGLTFVVVGGLIYSVSILNIASVRPVMAETHAKEHQEEGHGMTGAEGKASEKKDTAKDSVCGMEVNKDKSIKLEHDGKTFYFCSKICGETFKKEPSKYLKEKGK